MKIIVLFFFFSSRRRHTRLQGDWSSDVCSSDLSDPKWQFVVLNVGEDQGVLEHGELLINRDGKLVAKVKVSSVQKDRCVANVMPGWQIGEIFEGDLVIPAHPAS